MIAENIASLRDRIRRAAERCGRNPDDILLVAVSKTFGAEQIEEALKAGLSDFGENYVQEFERKRSLLKGRDLRWHFIGHLQTNKVRHIIDHVHLIHSVDSLRLAEEIEKRSAAAGRTVGVLLEVHTTDEATKYGVPPEATIELVRAIAPLKHLRIQGLMTMGPFTDNPEDSRLSFRRLAELRKAIQDESIEGVEAGELSMGMTHDFEVAVEEGATILRIGTAIFGRRPSKA